MSYATEESYKAYLEHRKEVAKERRLNRECTVCGDALPLKWTYVTCPFCHNRREMRDKNVRQEKKEKGTCVRCGRKMPNDTEFTRCIQCRMKQRKVKKDIYERRVYDKTICTRCGSKLKKGDMNLCEKCRAYHAEDQKMRYRINKANHVCPKCKQKHDDPTVICRKCCDERNRKNLEKKQKGIERIANERIEDGVQYALG